MIKSRAVFVVFGASLYLALFVVFSVLLDAVAQPAAVGAGLLWPLTWLIYLALPPLAVTTGLGSSWASWQTSNRFSLLAAATLLAAVLMALLPALLFLWRTYEQTVAAVAEERMMQSTLLHLPTITALASALALTVLVFIGHRVFGSAHEKTRPA